MHILNNCLLILNQIIFFIFGIKAIDYMVDGYKNENASIFTESKIFFFFGFSLVFIPIIIEKMISNDLMVKIMLTIPITILCLCYLKRNWKKKNKYGYYDFE